MSFSFERAVTDAVSGCAEIRNKTSVEWEADTTINANTTVTPDGRGHGPRLFHLRSDPRFHELLHRMVFPP